MTGLCLGETWDEAGEGRGLYLPEASRGSHVYVIGASGAGKSKALASWAIHDWSTGSPFGLIDLHGDLVTDVLAHSGSERVRLLEFASSDMATINPLEPTPPINIYRQTTELVDVFRKIWKLDEAAPRLLEILRNAIWTLIESGGTLLELQRLLTDAEFRGRAVMRVTNEEIADFWRNRFDRWTDRERTSNIESTLNKASAFTADPRLRLLLGAKKSTLDFRKAMDLGETVLIDLNEGELGPNANLIGALLLSRIQMAAVGRLRAPRSQRRPWTLYVDEFQNFATDSFAEILAEARKMGLRVVLAHQTLAQNGDEVKFGESSFHFRMA